MSADLMLVSEEQNQNYKSNSDDCVYIDETSMGCPHTDFGKLLSQQEIIDDALIEKVKVWFDVLDHKDFISLDSIVKWLENHRGEYLQTECW